eukprot:GSChrysophyteH1.ASY1.ANO1.1355.1 assembled CDS
MPQVFKASLYALLLDFIHIFRLLIDIVASFLDIFLQSDRSLERHYKKKTVLITGASGGLGKALALELAQLSQRIGEPIHLVLSARNEVSLNEVQQACLETSHPGSKIMIVPVDLSTLHNSAALTIQYTDKIKKALHSNGLPVVVDCLVNNAGVSSRGCALETDSKVLESIMNINFFGCAALTKSVLRELMLTSDSRGAHEQRSIGVISSVQGRLGIAERTSYAASKHALQGWFDGLRCELVDKNISVTVVSPGYIATNLSVNAVTATGAAYGRTDPTTAAGYDPHYAARKVLRAISQTKVDFILADAKVQAAVQARGQLSDLLAGQLAKKSSSDKSENKKVD